MRIMSFRRVLVAAATVAAMAGVVTPAGATHSWGGYHWARTSNPMTLKLGNNVTSAWTGYLATSSVDWSISTVLDTTVVPGSTNARCRAKSGTVQVCNAAYGNNGWLGIASISISGGTHITQGTVKLNDTYFNTATYNTTAWRNLVMCQEIGHTFGLDHQDEVMSNANLNTCMDYTNSPGTNQFPNQHDYDQLVSIYAHLDSTTTVSSATATARASAADAARGPMDTPGEWGRRVSGSDNPRQVAVYERDFGGGEKEVTFVIWA